ncbi:MAG: hypothetical protein ACO23N_01500 [Opitutales bacterium]|jgi:hypothetical protein
MRFALLTLCLLQVGCNVLSDEQRQAELERKAEQDRAMRRQHMLSTGAVRESEYDVIGRKTGTSAVSGKLPPPPTTAEMEERAKEGAR